MTIRLWNAEQVVNTVTSGGQVSPQVARLGNGAFVVVWADYSASPTDGRIKAQLFNSDGTRAGAELTLADTVGVDERGPSVAATADGGFRVAWTSGTGDTVHTYALDGVDLGITRSGAGVTDLHLAGGLSGKSSALAHTDTATGKVRLVTFDSAGAQVADVQVQTGAGAGHHGDVAVLSNGRYAVTWSVEGSGVFGRLMNFDGTPLSAEFQVNATSLSGSTDTTPHVTSLQGGAFLVTWHTPGSAEAGAEAFDVRGRIFNAAGAPAGPDFLVNSFTSGDQTYSDAVPLLGGGFIEVWSDAAQGAIKAQQYDNLGSRVGSETIVGLGGGAARGLHAELLGDGRVSVVWEASDGGGSTDIKAVILDARDGNIVGTTQAETLYGGSGDDVIQALGGDDTVLPGLGNDQAFGGAGNDILFGAAGDDRLDGGDGNDLVLGGTGADTMIGGLGDDTFELTDAGDSVSEQAGGGTDIVVAYVNGYTLADNVENIVLAGSALIAAGNALDNVMFGNAGANVLIGKGGNDSMFGGAGNDTYEVTELGDQVFENAGEGTDKVFAYLGATDSYRLGANFENLQLVSGANLFGNDLNNELIGNDADNIFIGGLGADVMRGGGGDDSFEVDNLLDWADPGSSAGNDTAYILVENFGMGVNSAFDVAVLMSGVVHFTGNNILKTVVGNDLANDVAASTGTQVLYGYGGDDLLKGLAGNDVIYGGDGNDVLQGGTEADVMFGQLGDDSYEVDNAADSVFENAGEGTDTIVSFVSYALSANVENLTLVGVGRDAIGNALDNVLIGNTGGNTIVGGGGNDTMVGGAGNDTYEVAEDGDVVTENANQGTDRVYTFLDGYVLPVNVESLVLAGTTASGFGNGAANELIGNNANNTLNGGAGIDTLIGGQGDDTLTGGTELDLFHWTGGVNAGRDVITDFTVAGERVIVSSVLFANFAALNAAATQVGADTVITFNASTTLTLQNVDKTTLTSANFTFSSSFGAPEGDPQAAPVLAQAEFGGYDGMVDAGLVAPVLDHGLVHQPGPWDVLLA